jgi:hypothetical protein
MFGAAVRTKKQFPFVPPLKGCFRPPGSRSGGLSGGYPKWMPLLEEYYGEEYEIFNRYRKIDNQEGTPMMWKNPVSIA